MGNCLCERHLGRGNLLHVRQHWSRGFGLEAQGGKALMDGLQRQGSGVGGALCAPRLAEEKERRRDTRAGKTAERG